MASPAQAQLINALLAIISGVESWKQPNNVGNIVADAITTLSTAEAVDPNLVIANEFDKAIKQAPASLAALETGQPAIGPIVTINGKQYESFLVERGSAWATQNLGG